MMKLWPWPSRTKQCCDFAIDSVFDSVSKLCLLLWVGRDAYLVVLMKLLVDGIVPLSPTFHVYLMYHLVSMPFQPTPVVQIVLIRSLLIHLYYSHRYACHGQYVHEQSYHKGDGTYRPSPYLRHRMINSKHELYTDALDNPYSPLVR